MDIRVCDKCEEPIKNRDHIKVMHLGKFEFTDFGGVDLCTKCGKDILEFLKKEKFLISSLADRKR